MKRIKYSIKLLSPVVISASSGDMNTVDCLDYIPGSTILGIFASRYIKNKKLTDAHTDNNFRDYFLRGSVIFSNAYLKQNDREYLPTPISIQKKKSDGSMVNLIKEDTDVQIQNAGQFCSIAGSNIVFALPDKRMNFHHSRKDNRIEGKSDDGTIFNYVALNEGQEFSGYILADDGKLETCREIFSPGQKIPCRIGRSKNTQYGNAELSLGELEDCPANTSGGKESAITFTSPAIFLNKNGYPEVSAKILKEYLENNGLEVGRIEQIFAKTEDIETFIARWGRKKPADKAFAAGTTFKITINNGVEKLKELEQKGIGERLGEGFGRIKINWGIKDEYSEVLSEANEIAKPNGELPALLKKIFTNIIVENIRNTVIVKALEDANSAKSLPANSLLGRLELDLKNNSSTEFETKVGTYRETATNSLKKCRIGEETLHHLITEGAAINNIRESDPITNFARDTGVNMEEINRESSEKLYQLYWLTFFSRLRKSNKAKKTGKEAGNE